LAFVNDKWRVVDTTPAVWTALESKDITIIEPLVDFWSWISYRVATWDMESSEPGKTNVFIWLLVPVLLLYLWKGFIKPRMNASGNNKPVAKITDNSRLSHSGFYKLMQELEKRYGKRETGETLIMWITRVEKNHHKIAINDLLKLFYQYRYDPEGLQPDEESELNNLTDSLLTKMNI